MLPAGHQSIRLCLAACISATMSGVCRLRHARVWHVGLTRAVRRSHRYLSLNPSYNHRHHQHPQSQSIPGQQAPKAVRVIRAGPCDLRWRECKGLTQISKRLCPNANLGVLRASVCAATNRSRQPGYCNMTCQSGPNKRIARNVHHVMCKSSAARCSAAGLWPQAAKSTLRPKWGNQVAATKKAAAQEAVCSAGSKARHLTD